MDVFKQESLKEQFGVNTPFADLQIQVGSHIFYVHKPLVCFASSFFKTLFAGNTDMKEKQEGRVVLQECSESAVLFLLRCYYQMELVKLVTEALTLFF